jgi:tripartite-type tricarboxylate transporter receptor subunit TctC
MIKKIIIAFFTTASLSAYSASIIVPVVWPFSVGSNQVNFVRTVIEEANNQQKKYKFVMEFKPGAGGAIAARYVENYNGLSILYSSASFFSRPVFYPNESHKAENFKPVYIFCVGQPYLIVGTKLKSLDDIRKQDRVTVGANFGSITEAMARELQVLAPNTVVDVIPFASGTLGPAQELIAGRIDLNVSLPSDTLQWLELDKATVVGSTGTKDYKYFKTFHSQGVKGFESMVGSYAMYIPATTNTKTIEELHNVMSKGAVSAGSKLQEYYALDYCPGVNYTIKQTNDLYNNWLKYWPEKLSKLKVGS